MRVQLSRTFTFEAAHRLPTFPEGHKCRRLHGHSFKVEIILAGEVDEAKGYLVDYGEVKAVCQPVFDRLDHQYLNEIEGLENPTAELLARWIWRQVRPNLPHLAAVVVRETCNTSCEYRGE
ncbi:MAG TPA: 6-carboxytetrahydropterin synthase QueD [Phycisphaerae bacterium]|nr:6-carboxytetrahydropterin synthase QueD [Phycisphaerae bacterium]